ncbi:acetolactate synthase large subunit [Desulfosediminicola ganghwensis]|uniref:acetolactate synthase large subunit n=1 Tax=Desulfosediminicola ganghwensis TaxID=2569540 RepID=UPI0010AD9030|nr:acetolactate synthase large subunit [Desulfosediminicola ganghwensis]
MQTMNGAELIIRLLERQGITTVSGIPGGANLPLYDALYSRRKIRHVLARHEQGAGFMAQGMARSTGEAAVCFATSGPGATNIMTAIADAYLDSIPVVCITGQVPTSLIGTDAFQEVDTYGMSIPITKHNFMVRSAQELLHVIPEAFRLATSGRPGPVLIDVPKDVQQEQVSFARWVKPGQSEDATAVPEGALRLAAKLINAAKRPVLCLGGGVIHADAAEAAMQLAEHAKIPTAMTLMGLGAMPADAQLSLGMLGMHAARSTNMILQECDLFIAAGARFDDRATGKLVEFCPNARIIHMDIDPSEVNKLKTANIGLVGDVKATLEALLPLIGSNRRSRWLNRVRVLQNAYPMTNAEKIIPEKPYGIILEVARRLGDDAIIATDVGKHQMWTAQVYPFARPRQLLTSGGLGTMGFGLPTAIGAALANPEKRVVCFSGDGSLQMNIQELATAVEQQLNVTVIVMNNNSLGLVRQQQGLFYSQHHFASDFQIDINFATIARGFGMRAYDVGIDGKLEDVLEAALNEPGPCLVNAPIGKEEEVYPIVPPGAANISMIGGSYAKQIA